jgi:Xaa-Pro aminopeptidase
MNQKHVSANRKDVIIQHRIEKVRTLLSDKNLKGILVESQANFSWLTRGGRSFIGLNSEAACASLLVTQDNFYLLSSNIEAQRLLSEEIVPEIEQFVFPWYEDLLRIEKIKRICGSTELVKTDGDFVQSFQYFRTVLDEEQKNTYRYMAPRVAAILEETALGLRPGTTELETAGILSAKLWPLKIEPVTLLIAFDDRISNWRHPLPTDNILKKRAMLSLAVRYKGLFISATRQVCFGKSLVELELKHRAVCQIEADIIRATKPEVPMEDLFHVLVDSYKKNGYPDEWQNHHQGGLTGYLSRESKAMPGNKLLVEDNQAFAWNPTIRGTKSEDTIVVESGKPDFVTHTGKWQYAQYNDLPRPIIIEI